MNTTEKDKEVFEDWLEEEEEATASTAGRLPVGYGQVQEKEDPITEKDLLRFSIGILIGGAVLFAIVLGIKLWTVADDPIELKKAGEEIWGYGTYTLSSIIGLILGYYFGAKSRK